MTRRTMSDLDGEERMRAHLQPVPTPEAPHVSTGTLGARQIGWRVLSSLQIGSSDVVLHRSVMSGLEDMLRVHNGLSYLDEDHVVISFEIADASARSREFAHEVLLKAQAMVPMSTVGDTELHRIDREAMHSAGPTPVSGLRLAD